MAWLLVVKGKFDAAHRLAGYPGSCADVHGHTWKVEVAVKVDKLNDLGIGVDFKLLKTALESILSEFDHGVLMRKGDVMFEKMLTKTVEFPENPTAEVIAMEVYRRMKTKLGVIRLEWVRVWESENAYAEYLGE
jgi:6-pyruvoyltetrahydropterin/6-carboxytetrahydropterin synthase